MSKTNSNSTSGSQSNSNTKPANGPSKTGNPSGKRRGNNPPKK